MVLGCSSVLLNCSGFLYFCIKGLFQTISHTSELAVNMWSRELCHIKYWQIAEYSWMVAGINLQHSSQNLTAPGGLQMHLQSTATASATDTDWSSQQAVLFCNPLDRYPVYSWWMINISFHAAHCRQFRRDNKVLDILKELFWESNIAIELCG